MELPPVRYVHTADGVSLAYTVFGEGPPLFYAFAGPGLSFFEFEWNYPELVAQFEIIARERTVVRFDWRNTGLSTRGVADVSPAAQLRDLLALQGHLGFERIGLRVHGSAQTAVRFAATHPDRVSSLILSSPSVKPVEPNRTASVGQQLMAVAAGADWRLFARLFAVRLAGWEGPETTWFAEFIESAASPDDFFRTNAAMSDDDVSDLLGSVDCPVLIIQRRDPPDYFFEEVDPEHHLAESRLLTRDLPQAQLVILDGSSMMISADPAATSALISFLNEADPSDQANSSIAGGEAPVRTIMFTDLEGHTEMMQRLGDAQGREVLREHERITRSALASHGGGEVKTMGDGFLATFASPQRALECAAALQRSFAAHPGEPLSVRIGLNAGEPIDEDADIFGAAVIAAARIGAHAAGGQVLVSDVVRQLAAGKGFAFDDLGDLDLKGMDEPVRVWELAWADPDSP
jgi:class 3 adenylate cyclase